MKFFKSFDEFNNWNYDNCQAKLVDVFTRSGNNFVVLDRISGSYYCNPKYFETDIDAKIYAKDNFILEKVVIMLFDMEKYIASYKHLIGCEILDYVIGEILIFSIENTPVDMVINGMFPLDNFVKFYLDDENLGTYEEYMQLHYPDYVHVWKHQL